MRLYRPLIYRGHDPPVTRALALAETIRLEALLRAAIVYGCAGALIAAARFLP